MADSDAETSSDASGGDACAKLAYTPDINDHRASAAWILTHTKLGRKTIRRIGWSQLFVFVIMTGAIACWNRLAAVIFMVLMLIGLLLRGQGSLKKYLLDMAVRGSLKTVDEKPSPIEGLISADSFQFRSSGTTVTYSWDGVRCFNEPSGIYLVRKDNLLRFIPARAFAGSEATRQVICDIAENHVDNREAATPLVDVVKQRSRGAPEVRPIAKPDSAPVVAYGRSPSGVLPTVSFLAGIASLFLTCLLLPGLVLGLLALTTGLLADTSQQSNRRKILKGIGILTGLFSFAAASIVIVVTGSAVVFLPSLILRSVGQVIQNVAPVIDLSHKVTCTTRAAAIAQGCQLYATGHDSRFPAHLGVLLIDGICTPEQLCDPQSGTIRFPAAAMPKTEAEWPTIQAAVDKSSDFIYVGGDLMENQDEKKVADKLIVVYSDDLFNGTGLAMGFADGNARFVESTDIGAVVEECNRARAPLGLPTIRVTLPASK